MHISEYKSSMIHEKELSLELNIMFKNDEEFLEISNLREKFKISQIKIYGLKMERVDDYAIFHELYTKNIEGQEMDFLSKTIRAYVNSVDENT